MEKLNMHKLLTPDPARIEPTPHQPAHDSGAREGPGHQSACKESTCQDF